MSTRHSTRRLHRDTLSVVAWRSSDLRVGVKGYLRLRPRLSLVSDSARYTDSTAARRLNGVRTTARGYNGAALAPRTIELYPGYEQCNNCARIWFNPRHRRQCCPKCFGAGELYILSLFPGPGGQLALPLRRHKMLPAFGARKARPGRRGALTPYFHQAAQPTNAEEDH